MLSKDLTLDPEIIKECWRELEQPIPNKSDYMKLLMTERLDKINRLTLEDFNNCLKAIEEKVMAEGTTVKEATKLMKRLNKVSKKIYRSEIVLFRVLTKE